MLGEQAKSPKEAISFSDSFCDSCRIQTCNLLIRSQMLYSVELRSRGICHSCTISHRCDSCRIQTCNLLIRSQMLYSVELRSRGICHSCTISHRCDSCRIQTCNLLIRSQMLYSVELRSQIYVVCQPFLWLSDCKGTTFQQICKGFPHFF